MSGKTNPRTPMGPADRAPFGSARGGGRTKSRSRRSTRAVLPSFGALRRDNTPTAACLIVLSSCSGALSATVHTRPSVSVFWFRTEPDRTEPNLLLRCAWASFYMLKGSPTGGNVDKSKMEKEGWLVQLPVQCILPNPDGRGQRH